MAIFDARVAWSGLKIYRKTGLIPEPLAVEILNLSKAIVLSTCINRTDMDDIIQECALKALQSCNKYRMDAGQGKLHFFFSRVISNRCRDILRRKQAEQIEPATIEHMIQARRGKDFFQLYVDMRDTCLEIVVRRYPSIPIDDVADVFLFIYDVEIPTGISGGERKVLSIIGENFEIHRTISRLVRCSSLFVLRMGVLETLDLLSGGYESPREEEEMTLLPEFRVAHELPVEVAVYALGGFNVQFNAKYSAAKTGLAI